MKELIVKSKKYGDRVAMVDDEDFDLLKNHNWNLSVCGPYKNIFYAFMYIRDITQKRKYFSIKMHRHILRHRGLLTDEKNVIDHKDRNGLNNQKGNLRVCTQHENSCNNKLQKNNKTGFKGVFYDKRKDLYKSELRYDGKKYSKHTKSLVDAVEFYNEMAIKFHGEFASLNPLPEVKPRVYFIRAEERTTGKRVRISENMTFEEAKKWKSTKALQKKYKWFHPIESTPHHQKLQVA